MLIQNGPQFIKRKYTYRLFLVWYYFLIARFFFSIIVFVEINEMAYIKKADIDKLKASFQNSMIGIEQLFNHNVTPKLNSEMCLLGSE